MEVFGIWYMVLVYVVWSICYMIEDGHMRGAAPECGGLGWVYHNGHCYLFDRFDIYLNIYLRVPSSFHKRLLDFPFAQYMLLQCAHPLPGCRREMQ